MPSDIEQLAADSASFTSQLLRSNTLLLSPLLIARFIQPRRSWRLMGIAPRYASDFAVFRCLLKLCWYAIWRSTKGKFLILDSIEHGKYLPESELKATNIRGSATLLAKLATFLTIYDLELSLALNLIPHTEIADELDSVIGRYESEGNTLLSEIEQLDRKRRRRDVQVFVSGFLGLSSIILFIYLSQLVDLARIVTFDFLYGAGAFLAILILFTSRIWWFFPPLLRSGATPQANRVHASKSPS